MIHLSQRYPASFPGGIDGKESTSNEGDLGFNPWVGKSPWRRAWQPTPVLLPGESPLTEDPGRLQSVGSQSWTRLKQLACTAWMSCSSKAYNVTDSTLFSAARINHLSQLVHSPSWIGKAKGRLCGHKCTCKALVSSPSTFSVKLVVRVWARISWTDLGILMGCYKRWKGETSSVWWTGITRTRLEI